MLVQFSVGNFRSFKDVVTLDLTATNLVSKNKEIDENNTFEAPGGLKLLKSVVLYGANASGKSNLLKALEFMKTFVNNSAKESQAGDPIKTEPFLLDSETENAPSFFEIVFILDKIRYRYGFEVTTKEVVSEWLYHTPNKKESYLFTRDKQGFNLSRNFKEGQQLQDKTRNNALFLSVVEQFNGRISTSIVLFFRVSIFNSKSDDALTSFSKYAIFNKSLNLREIMTNLVKNLDLAIEEVDLRIDRILKSDLVSHKDHNRIFQKVMTSNSPEKFVINEELEILDILTLHKKFDGGKYERQIPFSLEDHESDGTQKLFGLSGILIWTLIRKSILVIDEIDARLHPILTAALIDIFHSKAETSQLIVTTHDVNLLQNDRFRRDQIWFVEKDKFGASHLYSLSDFKIRNDASYQKDYLAGRYGAIPFIGAQNFLEGFQDGKTQKAR